MAALDFPIWEAVSPEMQQLIAYFGQQSFSNRFYLAGGTALALQIGHRRSVDLDFFSQKDEVGEKSRREIIRRVSPFSIEVIENVDGNLLMLANGIRVGFFSYPYPLVSKPVKLENISLASLVDIGLMKCDALISRGSRKDFYDLFNIAKYVQFEQLLQLGGKKYPLFRDFSLMVVESMILFENADRDIQPAVLENITWDQVKQYFVKQANLLSQGWFGEG